MLFNSKGRLFWKISITDLIVFLIVLLAVAGLGYKYAKSKTVTPFTATDNIEIQFYCDEVPEFVAKSISEGDIVRDPTRNAEFGKVSKVERESSRSIVMTDDGEYKASPKPEHNSLLLTVEGKGLYGNSGVTFNNVDYYVGNIILFMRAGNTAVDNARIYSIKKVE